MTSAEDSVLDQAALDTIQAEASALMKQGMAHAAGGDAAAVASAIACFDAAAALRRQLPLAHPPFRYDLAACYLNRAEACLTFDSEAQFEAAVRAIDEALYLLQTLPLQEDARFTRRLVIAYQNRGLAHLALARVRQASRAQARADFERTAAMLDRSDVARPLDGARLLATASVNLAGCLADDGVFEDAAALATRALTIERGGELDAQPSAEISLSARHLLCRRLAQDLASRSRAAGATDVSDATDLADEALAVVAHWERAGVTRFRELGHDFFRFGALAYALAHPRFVEEFIAEWLAPSRTSAGFADDPVNQDSARQARAASAPDTARTIRFTFGDLGHTPRR